jgi:hypothetical protein
MKVMDGFLMWLVNTSFLNQVQFSLLPLYTIRTIVCAHPQMNNS